MSDDDREQRFWSRRPRSELHLALFKRFLETTEQNAERPDVTLERIDILMLDLEHAREQLLEADRDVAARTGVFYGALVDECRRIAQEAKQGRRAGVPSLELLSKKFRDGIAAKNVRDLIGDRVLRLREAWSPPASDVERREMFLLSLEAFAVTPVLKDERDLKSGDWVATADELVQAFASARILDDAQMVRLSSERALVATALLERAHATVGRPRTGQSNTGAVEKLLAAIGMKVSASTLKSARRRAKKKRGARDAP